MLVKVYQDLKTGGGAMGVRRASWIGLALLIGLLVVFGCGPSEEQRAIDAYNRGVDHHEKSEVNEAIADYTEAIRLNPGFAEAYYNRGILCGRDKDDLDRAIADFGEAIRINPKFVDAYHTRGLASQRKGEQAKAEADFAKARELGYEPQ
jgi:tetratricopeptide (TPR) repeat protein